MNKTEQHKKALLEALEKSLGVVTTACKKAGVGRTTYYEWYNSDVNFRSKVDELQNIALDFAESKLHEQISNNSTPATIFYLKTKGKHRGYVERQEVRMNAEVGTYKLSSEAKKKIDDILNDEY